MFNLLEAAYIINAAYDVGTQCTHTQSALTDRFIKCFSLPLLNRLKAFFKTERKCLIGTRTRTSKKEHLFVDYFCVLVFTNYVLFFCFSLLHCTALCLHYRSFDTVKGMKLRAEVAIPVAEYTYVHNVQKQHSEAHAGSQKHVTIYVLFFNFLFYFC